MKLYEKLKDNKFIWLILGGIIISIASVSAAIIVSSNDVSISSSKTDKTNLHDAIDELYSLTSNECPYGQTCVRCGAGSYADQTNMVCNTCVAGTYSLGGVNSCITCPDGYTSDAEAKSEAECYIRTTAGKYIAVANDSTQTDCPEGSYCPVAKVYYGGTGSIESCGENMTSSVGSTSLSDCHAMYVTCPDGYTSDGNVTDVSECYIQTTAGKYIKNDGTETNCPTGYYCPGTKIYYGTNVDGKIACPSGYTNSAIGSDEITDCYVRTTAGRYIKNTYDTTQTTCEANSYCLMTDIYYGSTGGIEACPNGYTKSAAGANAISKCYVTTTGGKYIKTAKATTQTQCPANSYCPSSNVYYGSTGKITACGSGKTSPAGSDDASDCKSATTTVTRTGDGGYVGTYTCSGGTGTLTSCVLKTNFDGATCRAQNGTTGLCTQYTQLASEPKWTCDCPDTYACKQLGHLTDTISC